MHSTPHALTRSRYHHNAVACSLMQLLPPPHFCGESQFMFTAGNDNAGVRTAPQARWVDKADRIGR